MKQRLKSKQKKVCEIKTSRINKLLARPTKKIRDRIHINKIRTERGEIEPTPKK